MGIFGGRRAVRVLTWLSANGYTGMAEGTPPAYRNRNKLEVLLGPSIWDAVRGKRVVDFGCGLGHEAVEMVERGAAHVVGVEVYEPFLEQAKSLARQRGVTDRCTFVRTWAGEAPADLIVSVDAFEHFDDPAAILEVFRAILKPGGCVLASFGPTWYHPYGGHIYSVVPYAHLVFTERALVDWRATLPGKTPARTFGESGINKMTVSRFERVVAASPFQFTSFEVVPIRPVRWAANRLTREFTTSIVRCRLELRPEFVVRGPGDLSTSITV
jgi:SAM-dependent methyltransferase